MADERTETTQPDDLGSTHRRKLLMGGGAAVAAGAAALAATASPAGAVTTVVPVYLPIDPFRFYDSRQASGRIRTGQTDTIVAPEPAPDFAWCFNLTVTKTTGTGWLAVREAGTAYTGTSNINWFGANQTLANNAYTTIRPADCGVSVLCGGGGTTEYLLDVVAALMFIPLESAAEAMAERSAPVAAAAHRFAGSATRS